MVHFCPFPPCSCGAIKKLVDFQQEDYVLQFLMGLKESYAHLRSQILLFNPLPPINKVFSLVLQKEKQREIVSDSLSPTESVAMLSNRDPARDSSRGSTGSNGPKHNKSFVSRKDRPYCTHCGLSMHTIDKCYKIHSYPLGYKLKSQNPNINQAIASQSISDSVLTQNFHFSQEQCKQLISFLQNHSNVSSVNQSSTVFTPSSSSVPSTSDPSYSSISIVLSSIFSNNTRKSIPS
ncbi:hypothetical protein I3760_03G155800 [Carya illinoinensis]|nr:hypothetical protein I3760_03G155800 [Carya illinoinensis]